MRAAAGRRNRRWGSTQLSGWPNATRAAIDQTINKGDIDHMVNSQERPTRRARRGSEDKRRSEILRAAYRVATRQRLAGVTARAVAEDAGVSSGLVFFYFDSVDRLQTELLDWLLARTVVAGDLAELTGAPGDPAARMMAVIRRDVECLPRQRDRVELFFDYWVLGTRHPDIRARIRGALDRYRDAFLPLARAVVESDPQRYAGVDAEGLASVAAGFVEGCAVQVVMDPAAFDVERSMATLTALVRSPVSPLT
jgi:TetR/AcrR family transcriptional regulator, transcriptional repressor of bet genes